MIDRELIYNDEQLVILPTLQKELLSAFEYTYKNVLLLDLFGNLSEQINFIKNSNFKQIILVDYYPEYEGIIYQFQGNRKIKIFFTKSLGAFSNESTYIQFKDSVKLLEQNKICKIGFIDSNLYNVFKNRFNCCVVSLDIEKKEYSDKFNDKRVGILNEYNKATHSYYNELSALAFKNYTASLKAIYKESKDFLKLFNIKYTVNEKGYMDNNLVNLYVNFTDNNPICFIESMDRNIPCILGNNDLLNDSPLKKYLVLESDDSIDEIKDKIELVKNNRNAILKEYKSFREEYSKKCIKDRDEFLEYKIEEKKVKEKETDLLLSIVVPVYNTEKYLKACLDSIISSLPSELKNSCEILVINDGSTDNSETIIKEYEQKYKYIKYIYQKNKGLGNVRNVALKHIRGKYIASIDSDDTVSKAFFKDVYNAIQKDVDVFICDWLSKTNTDSYNTAAIEYGVFDDLSKYEGILYSSIVPSTCNKVFKKVLFDELGITYLEDKYEDLSTNPFILLRAKKIQYVNQPYYEYYIRSNSIMRSSAGLSMVNVIKEFYKRLDKYKEYCNVDIDKFKYYVLSWRMEVYIFNQLYSGTKNEKDTLIKYTYDNLYNEVLDIISNKYYQEMLNGLEKSKKEFINNRNKAFKDKKLIGFKFDNPDYKITAPTVYFGEKK